MKWDNPISEDPQAALGPNSDDSAIDLLKTIHVP
jgi:hypothetical protein